MPDGIGLMGIIGGVALLAVLLFAVLSNRRRTAASERRTEQATHDLYKAVDREDKATDPDPKTF
jgi:hypothetical protein